jgi:hypothetical protein
MPVLQFYFLYCCSTFGYRSSSIWKFSDWSLSIRDDTIPSMADRMAEYNISECFSSLLSFRETVARLCPGFMQFLGWHAIVQSIA